MWAADGSIGRTNDGPLLGKSERERPHCTCGPEKRVDPTSTFSSNAMRVKKSSLRTTELESGSDGMATVG
jgi:hypothetical protein